MGYEPDIYITVNRELESRRNASRAEVERHRAEIDRKLPEIRQLEDELAQTAIAVTRSVISGGEPGQLEALRLRGLQVLEKKEAALRAAGYPADYLTERHTCERCNDTGSVNGRRCVCMTDALREEAAARLDRVSGVGRVRFADFRLDYYSAEVDPRAGRSPRELMEKLLNESRAYVDGFGSGSANLFFQGGPGLGKTFLSLAIAYGVSDRGFGVIYGSAADLLGLVEREHFDRGNERVQLDRLLDADFLVLDDLGAEFSTSFSVATVFNVLNTRLLRSLPTLISTNLTLPEISDRYGERFLSRVVGQYTVRGFRGQDIRLQKRRAN